MLAKSICVDGYNLSMPQGSGITTYGRNLLNAIDRMGFEGEVLYGPEVKPGRDNVLNEVALADAYRERRKMQKAVRYSKTIMTRFGRSTVLVEPSGEVIWPERMGGRPLARRYRSSQDLYYFAVRGFQRHGTMTPLTLGRGSQHSPDVMHWTSTLPVYARDAANIYTIHDLIPLRLPHATLESKTRYRFLVGEIAKKADHIAVVSESTRQDVIRLLGVPEHKVTNTYQSVSIEPGIISRSQDDVDLELRGIFDLGWKDYYLHFGAIEPKKNLGRIVEAYLSSGVTKPLIIVGGRSWLDGPEVALLNQVKNDGGLSASRLRRYEFMTRSMLVSLIRGARATLFPSLFEGFGLPVLESMLLETAVLTSNGGALPEVSGDAAVIVDPYDVQAITRGLQALDADDDLVLDLVAKGKVQAARFSQEAFIERLKGLYASVGVS
ncbi:glycosyltransferase family 1 protein [Brevundimonas sp.]|uniref:glycosyltransferase family 4 protein n=1 Tax=Brevundimonas sp. TaxID=1871086 RepID=UPI00289C872E|nr:glycosyltransferase family 1 protein [Brevundimonas sp.]